MLQNEPQPETLTPPGQVRITPEELSQAVAAIERRKEAEASRLAGTIPIDEAVSSLHLNATPEEIWAEVQAQRHAVASPAPPGTTSGHSPRAQFGPAQTHAAQTQTVPASLTRPRPWKGVLAIGAGLWFLHVIGFGPHIGSVSRPSAPALTATAAQLPDGKAFYCDDAGLIQISEGNSLSQIHVSPTRPFSNSWTLVKMNGHVYLRAYTAYVTSVQPLTGKPLVVVNDDNSGTLEGEKTSQATLRVDNVPLQISGGDDGYTEITLPHFQPDQFTTTSEWR